MESYVDLLSGLYYFRLGLVQKSERIYALYDIDSDNMYEDMSIYYIRHLIRKWSENRGKENNPD